MSEKETKKTKKVTKGKFTKAQAIGLWVLLAAMGLFWGGVYVGTQATLSSQAHEAHLKASAVEEYKASLKTEK